MKMILHFITDNWKADKAGWSAPQNFNKSFLWLDITKYIAKAQQFNMFECLY